MHEGGTIVYDYKVLYQYCGCDFLCGYAESVGEAIELRDKCADEGWRKIKIKRWHLNQWVTVNV